jgi:aromatic-L-amino-acid/L-tryptophan decarboxylase
MPSLDLSNEQFRSLAEQVTKTAADYLQSIDSHPVAPNSSADRCSELFTGDVPEQGLGAQAFEALTQVPEHCRAQNGRFFGYVLGSGEPVAALADLLASVLNQNVTAWRSSPAAVTIEKTVVGWLARAIGCQQFGGSLTGGGSAANLMGLALARESKMQANEKGLTSLANAIVYASEEVHMSIPKSIALLGIGRDNLRLIPTDEKFHLLPDKLDQAIGEDRAAGKLPIAVVATAGTVNTGAIDPLADIAAICKKHETWLHVDGAYGALAAMAVPTRFRGMDLADSISLDAHKWLYQPLDCGCLLFRNPDAARKAFSHTGEYARSLSTDPVEGFAFFDESMELSRRFRSLKLWLSLRYHGLNAFRESIRKDLAQARRLAEAIVGEPQLELLAPIELSAVCFRYLGNGGRSEAELNRLNTAILKRMNQRGRVYLSNASLRAKFCLRVCIVNHRTTDADVDSVIPEVLESAREVLS